MSSRGKSVAKVRQREELFALNYLAMKFNARQAALACGVAPIGADVWATRTLKKTSVQELIWEKLEALKKRHDLTIDTVIMELKAIGFSNIKNYTRLLEDGNLAIDFENSTEEQMKAVESVEFDERIIKTIGESEDGEARKVLVNRKSKLKLYGKREALVDLLKFLQGNLGKMDGAIVNDNSVTNVDARTVNVTVQEVEAGYRKMLDQK